MKQEQVTEEELNKEHREGLNSVSLINRILKKEELNEFDKICIASNILHLYSLMEKFIWVTEQSEPFLTTVLSIGDSLPELETEEKAMDYYTSRRGEYRGPGR